MPFGGVLPMTLAKMLRNGDRMDAPENSACSSEVYVCYYCEASLYFWRMQVCDSNAAVLGG